MAQEIYKFGIYALDLLARELRVHASGQVLLDRGRALDLLGYLVQKPGKAILRTAVIADVWPADVSDGSLTQQLRILRRILDDNAAVPRFIETKGGHVKFIAEVEVAVKTERPCQSEAGDLGHSQADLGVGEEPAGMEGFPEAQIDGGQIPQPRTEDSGVAAGLTSVDDAHSEVRPSDARPSAQTSWAIPVQELSREEIIRRAFAERFHWPKSTEETSPALPHSNRPMILGLSVILFFAALLWMWVAGYRFGPQRRAIHVITSPVVWLVSAFFSGDWRSPAQPRGPILKSVKIDGKPMKMSTGERVLNYQVDWIGVWNKRTEINLIILDESTVLNSTTSAPPADFYLTDETGRRYDEPQLTAWGEDSWSGQIDGHSAYHQRISFAPLQVLSSHFQIHFNYANRVLAFDVLWPEGSSLPDQK